MIQLTETRDEFAARRRSAQEEAEQALLLEVKKAIDDNWSTDLEDLLVGLFQETYEAESGEEISDQDPRLVAAIERLKIRFDEYADPETSPEATALMFATALMNEATVAAAQDDPEPILLEWVTMHDSAVREAHREVDGQQRPPGEKFDVEDSEMSMPGDITAPIALWINCRCALRPTMLNEAALEGVTMSEQTSEVEPTIDLVPWHGILAPEGKWSGDGRQFAADSLTHRDLPLPLTYQKTSDDGHKGSVTVGSIETLDRVDGMMQATGFFLQTPEADEVIGLLAHFGKYGVSVDADDAEFDFSEEDDRITFTKARIASASIVSIPAFAEAYVALGMWEGVEVDPALAASAVARFDRGPGWVTHPSDTKRLHDYWTKPGEPGYVKINWGVPGDFNRCRALVGEKIATNSPEDMRFLNQICARWHHDALGFWPGHAPSEQAALSPEGSPAPAVSLVASAETTLTAPADWFRFEDYDSARHLDIDQFGRVTGYIAQWGVCHIGIDGVCTVPPHSETDYAYFANKSVLLDDGTFARTGILHLGGKHATGRLRAAAATKHYDDVAMAVCDVAIREDDHGIQVAGWVRPGTPQENIVALRASDISGDWREVGGNLELVAACSVNAGGFPVKVAASNGKMISLVAAGMIHREEKQQIDYTTLAREIVQEMKASEKRREAMASLASRFNKED